MPRGFRLKSLDGVTGTTNGTALGLGSHTRVSMMVVAPNLDTGADTLTVEVQVEVDGEWTPAGSALTVTESDFVDRDSDSTFSAFVYDHHVVAERVRASVSAFSDNADSNLTVDAYVLTGTSGDPQHGPRPKP